MKKLLVCILCSFLIMSFAYTTFSYADEYKMTLLESFIKAEAINDFGHIVGYSNNQQGRANAVLWENGSTISLGTLNCPSFPISYASDINNSDQIVGYSTITGPSGSPVYRGVLWENSGSGYEISALSTMSGYKEFHAYSINNNEQIVGKAYGPNEKGISWNNNGVPEYLNSYTSPEWVGGTSSINDSGQVVGYESMGGTNRHSLLWDQSGVANILAIGGYSYANDINNLGQVVGIAYMSGVGGPSQAYLWDPSNGVRFLATPGGDYGTAFSINDSGEIVGNYRNDNGVFSACMWDANGKLYELGTIQGDRGQSWAVDINNNGQIVGNALGHGILWEPVSQSVVPEPATMLLLPLGLAGFRFFRRRKK